MSFEDKYTGDPAFNIDQEEGREGMLETYGESLELLKKADPNKIWTIVDGDDDDMIIVAGMHYVNRINYFVSNEPWESEDEYYVWG